AGRADRLERRRWFHARRAQIQLAFPGRRRKFEWSEPKSLGHPLGHVLLLFGRRTLVFVAPSPELSFAILGHRSGPRDARSWMTAGILRPPCPRGQTVKIDPYLRVGWRRRISRITRRRERAS